MLWFCLSMIGLSSPNMLQWTGLNFSKFFANKQKNLKFMPPLLQNKPEKKSKNFKMSKKIEV